MKLTSATFATATTNLIPAATFVLALIFRYERLAIRTSSGQAKLAGTLLGVAGAMLLTFYKGADVTPPWHSSTTAVANLVAPHQQPGGEAAAAASNHLMGSLLCISSCFFYAVWLILQAKLSREYPFHYSSTALMCATSTLQSVAFALCYDRDPAQWRLGADVRLLSVAYTGVLASGVMLVVLSWCVKRRGPLFASVFNPLMLLVVAALGSLLLGEKLHLGSAIGAVLIVIGLYAVLWGKGREAELPAKVAGGLPTDDDDDDDGRRVDVVVQQLPDAAMPPHITHPADPQRPTTR
jgi:drug/metabolite transporter (DMT)-like permease